MREREREREERTRAGGRAHMRDQRGTRIPKHACTHTWTGTEREREKGEREGKREGGRERRVHAHVDRPRVCVCVRARI
jgi:hypothetical protein